MNRKTEGLVRRLPEDIDAADKTCCIIVISNHTATNILQLVKQCFQCDHKNLPKKKGQSAHSTFVENKSKRCEDFQQLFEAFLKSSCYNFISDYSDSVP